MISVIVPIYNISTYLTKCLETIIQQTFADLEIVLVDDGSTDGCGDICDAYGQKDARIVVVHKENGGLVSARKAGLRASHGEYITYVDGDDWIEPDLCEQMYQKMTEQGVDIVLCGHYEETGTARKEVFHGVPEGRYGREEMLRLVYPQMTAGEAFFECGILPMLCIKLFRRTCLERFQMAVDERIVMGEDAACVCPCLLHADSIYVMRRCLYHYRQSTSSMVKRIPETEQEREREREQFRVLYWSVRESLEKSVHVYDLREQWEKFLLSLMLPRAENLYAGFGSLDYLFPFAGVKKGARIILYGAGTYGQRLYRYLKETGFCQVVAWVDRNYRQFGAMHLPVEDPEVISGREYDAIVLAMVFAAPRSRLYRELRRKYPEEKICQPEEKLVLSRETKKAFGLTGENL